MSTCCKISPLVVRVRRSARANLLRQRAKSPEAAIIFAELALISANPRLRGSIKHKLFERGAYQLKSCK